MKSVMLSIQPKFCESVSNGNATILIRKTRPTIETPFKCYLYCTKSSKKHHNFLNGKVIGEFTCNEIQKIVQDDTARPYYDICDDTLKASRLTQKDLCNYAHGKSLYAWNISDLKIYDKPKELCDFYRYCGDYARCEFCKYFYFESNESVGSYSECCSPVECFKPLEKAPKSWCYCKSEVENG